MVLVFHAQKSGLSRLKMDKVTMNEVSFQMPDGVYTVFPIYSGGLVLRFEKHLERLEESALALGFIIKDSRLLAEGKYKKSIRVFWL